WERLRRPREEPTTATLRKRVSEARARQNARGVGTNAAIPDSTLDELVRADDAALALLGRAVSRLRLSARATRRVLRVARTIADLAGQERTQRLAVAEALQLRLSR
ncbi:MAG: hypothetical protein VCB25_03115, partial [Myxococcota bacterium]